MSRADVDVLASLARRLAAENDLTAVLQRVVDAAVTQIEGAEHAGITLLSRQSVSTPAATSLLVRQVDERQYATGDGPCLSAAQEHHLAVRVGDLAVDRRWPEFSAAAVSLGVRSMLSFQLYTDSSTGTDTIGALNVYAEPAEAFDEESAHTGTVLAARAAIAAAATTTSSNLRIALESRDTIGQAKAS